MITIKSLMIAIAVALTAAVVPSMAKDNEMMMSTSRNTHEEVVDGVKATFKILSMKERMKEMKMEMPQGVKETHHIMVEFKDVKTGTPLTKGEVKIKVQGPDKSEQVKELMAMSGMAGMGAGFGADFDFSKKGRYGIMTKFKLHDEKIRTCKFWYEVK